MVFFNLTEEERNLMSKQTQKPTWRQMLTQSQGASTPDDAEADAIADGDADADADARGDAEADAMQCEEPWP